MSLALDSEVSEGAELSGEARLGNPDAFVQKIRHFVHSLPRGFRLSVEDFVRIERVLVVLASEGRLPGSSADAARRLGPIVCRTPEQQQHSGDLVADWF